MSTTIDERVLEMRFDNRNFESNVSNTMSTLDKLKQKLNFTGASKGLDSVNTAAKNVNFTGLGSAVETVTAKFSAMDVVAATALANITNSAVNAGKRIVSALTIDPIKTGFQEYETQINAVQTILANTSSKGTTIDDVNRALEELNKYADMTIYNFTEMTRNIGTFTAAGVDLDTSTNAIKGIANLAAVSGSTSQQASTAMYQLSQALSSGTVKLMDWNSVVNAGMGGQVFQDALKETARVHGVNIDAMIEKQGSFRETLSEGWLTAEILTDTLQKFTLTTEGLTEEQIEANREMLRAKGYTEDQIDEIFKLGNTATNAATKVKTFTQLWDVLKEAAQSGWSQTWKLIIGDFEEAKALLTPLADFLTGVINKTSDFRNAIIKSALGRGFEHLSDSVSKIVKPAEKAAEVLQKVVDIGEIADKVIHGDFGNGVARAKALTEAGINHYEVQNKINEKLGDGYRYTQAQIDAQNELLGTQKKVTESTSEQGEATIELSDAQKEQLKDIGRYGDATLELMGYNEEQIAALRELQAVAEDLGIPFNDFIDNLDQINGRWLLMNSFKNIGKGLVDIGKAIGKAWKDVFPEHTVENFADKLFNLIAGFNKLTSSMTEVFYKKIGENKAGEAMYKLTDAGEKLVRTFKGVFAIIDIVSTVLGGGLKIAFKVLTSILGHFDLHILDVTAVIGDAIVGFRDWIDSVFDVGRAVAAIIPFIKDAITAVKDWIESLKTSENLPADIISGLVNGLRAGVGMVWDAAVTLARGIVDAVKSFLGIHSPSRVMEEIGVNTIEGFELGLVNGSGRLSETIIAICKKILEIFNAVFAKDGKTIDWKGVLGTIQLSSIGDVLKKLVDGIKNILTSLWDFITDGDGSINWGKIISGGMIIAMIWLLKQIATAAAGISSGIARFGGLVDGARQVMNSFSKLLDAKALNMKAEAFKKMAIAIGILAAAIIGIAMIDDIGKLWNAVGIIAALAVIMLGLSFAISKMNSASIDLEGKKIEGLKTGLMQIGLVMLMLAAAVKIIGEMDPAAAKQGLTGLAAIAIGLVVFIAAMGLVSRYTKDVSKIGAMMTKISIAMGLMVMVIKTIDSLNATEVAGGIIFAAAFAIFVRSITAIAKSAGNNVSKVGGMMIKLAIAMGLMVAVVKLVDILSVGEMFKGALFATGFAAFLSALVKCTKIGKKQQIAKLGGLVLSVSFSLMLMVGVCKLVSMLSYGEMFKGAVFVAGFIVMLKLLVSILTIGSEQKLLKVSGTLLVMAVAMGILATISMVLSLIDLRGLAKGVAAVGILGLVISCMVKSLRGANDVKSSIIAMTIAIVAMVGAVIALTFIDDTSKLAAAAGALALVMGMFALIAKCSNDINKAAVSLVVMTIAVGALATILWLLSNNIDNVDSAIKVAGSLAILMGALAISLKLIGGMKTVSVEAIGAMAGLVIILGGLAGIFAILQGFNIEPSIEAATALSVLLLAMSGAALILSKIGLVATAGIGGAAAFLALVGVAAIILSVVGGLVALIPGAQEFLDSGIPIIRSIGQALGEFIGGILGGIVGGAGEAMMDSFSNMVDTLGTIVDKLVEISNTGANINVEGFDGIGKLLKALAGIALVTAGTTITDIFTGLFTGQSSMEKFQTDCVAFFGAMKTISEASTGVTVDEAAMDVIIGVAKKLAKLQSSLEPIGGVISWFTGRDDLAAFGVNIGEFINSMKIALSNLEGTTFNGAAFDYIISAAARLAELQSSLEPIGGVISWFTGRDDLGKFGENVGVFITAMKTALSNLEGFIPNTEGLDVIISASEDLAELQSSLEPIGGVIRWFTGRDDLGKFGENVGVFITAMKTALATLEGTMLDEAALGSVLAAAKKLAEFQTSLEPMGGVIKWFSGRDDLGKFGTNVGLFADAMGKLKTAMGDDGITEAAITSMTTTSDAIIALIDVLPEEGWFDGKMNLTEFSDYITDFATAMSGFATTAAGIDTAAVSLAMSTAHSIKDLVNELVGLDTSGLATFTGLGTGGFGADGVAYQIAKTMSKYSKEVAGIDTAAVSTSVTAATTLRNLVQGLVGLDTSGIENFKIGSIASSMKAYANDISDIDADLVSQSVSIAVRLRSLIGSLTGLDASGIGNFKLGVIGSAMKTYGVYVAGLDLSGMSKSISTATKIKKFIESLAGLDASGASSFKTAINDLSTVNVSKFIEAFSGASDKLAPSGSKMIDGLIKGMKSKLPSAKATITDIISALNSTVTSRISSFKKSGVELMVKFVSGIESRKNAPRAAMLSCTTTAAQTIRAQYKPFFNAGSYLVDGFAAGVRNRTWLGERAARELAQAAIKAAKRELNINSPSKVFRDIGMGVPEGFALGVEKYSGLVDDSIVEMADSAVGSVGNTISKLASAINTDIDSQPTIRPVLDLSDVQSGAATIGNLFDTTSQVGVMANLGTVGAMMGRYNHGGGNTDIVNAIDKLRKDLGSTSSNTYMINGVTYDDGSNIADAVRTIARAAIMERRM